MAKSPKWGLESWLPTEFSAEVDFAVETEILKKNVLNADVAPGLSFPMEFPYEFDSFGSSSSSMSSPGESMVSSTETETSSDAEEDFLTGLTRRLTQSALSGTRKLGPKPESKWVTAGSSESSLSGTGQWSVSSNGSQCGLSLPITPFGFQEGYNGGDMIYEAASQVARPKMSDEAPEVYNSNFQAREALGPSRSQNQLTTAFCEAHGFTHNTVSQMNLQYQRAKLHQQVQQQRRLRQCASVWARHVDLNQQLQNQQIQCGGQRAYGLENETFGHPITMGMPTQSQHLKPGMKTIALGGSGVKRECAGTGVFLPRRYGNTPEPRNTSGCLTAIVPAKVVHALSRSFQGRNELTFSNILSSDYAATIFHALVAQRDALLSLQKGMLQRENHQLGRPQEWTY